jgi:thiol-disulfide isomerase/thioredoxin
MKRVLVVVIIALGSIIKVAAQPSSPPAGWWLFSLQREDGFTIDFNVDIKYTAGKPTWYIRNASERLAVTDIRKQGDSLLVQMPLFESAFYLKQDGKTLRGRWVRATSAGSQVMPVVAVYNQPARFTVNKKPAFNIQGKWATTFGEAPDTEPALAELQQQGQQLTGTFLTPTGDYRYLEGVVDGDSIKLTTFDGSHAYYFLAIAKNDSTLTNGLFISGARFKQGWLAVKNEKATLPDSLAAVRVKKGGEQLYFRFPDLDSNLVSVTDKRFRNKVVVVQIMGSWCPNCMDETAFLSDYYNRNKQKGIEMIALAYEYSTDFRRSVKSLGKFRQRFNMQYPILVTGVRVSDSLRTEKTLPSLTPIKMFPTTLFIGRDGKVKKIHTGFNGPATGLHYEAFKKEFYATVEELLKG